jgi:hypothetical protein
MPATAAGSAAGHTLAQAVRATGGLVRVDPADFQTLVNRIENPLVVVKEGGLFSPSIKYLTSYRGFILYTQSRQALHLPGRCEVLQASSVWLPL